MSERGPKNPSTTFFWNDWDNDEALKACSLAAQGLWMRCLCIAARSPEPGVVMIGRFPAGRTEITPRLAAVVGKSLDEVNALIDELLTSGTASLDRKQRIINRRMVKASALHAKRSAAGKNGADVTNGKKREIEGLPRQTSGKDDGKMTGGRPATGSPSSRLPSSDLPFETPAESVISREVDHEPIGQGAPDDLAIPQFLKGSAGRAQSLAANWSPSDDAKVELAKSRPDLTAGRIAERTNEFRNWCLENNKQSHNFDATWLTFMRKTHEQRPRRREIESVSGESATSAGIAAAFARRSV